MPTTILSPTELKYINFGPGAWGLVRGMATGNLAPGNATPYPSVNGADPNWTIQRSYWIFDTMTIPSFATITGARLKLHGCAAVGYALAGTAEIWYGGAYPHEPLVNTDFELARYAPSGGAEHVNVQIGMAADQTVTIVDPATIIVPYILGGYRFAIILDKDANNPVAPPIDGTYTFVFDGLDDAQPPTLEVDWEVYLRGTFAGPVV